MIVLAFLVVAVGFFCHTNTFSYTLIKSRARIYPSVANMLRNPLHHGTIRNARVISRMRPPTYEQNATPIVNVSFIDQPPPPYTSSIYPTRSHDPNLMVIEDFVDPVRTQTSVSAVTPALARVYSGRRLGDVGGVSLVGLIGSHRVAPVIPVIRETVIPLIPLSSMDASRILESTSAANAVAVEAVNDIVRMDTQFFLGEVPVRGTDLQTNVAGHQHTLASASQLVVQTRPSSSSSSSSSSSCSSIIRSSSSSSSSSTRSSSRDRHLRVHPFGVMLEG